MNRPAPSKSPRFMTSSTNLRTMAAFSDMAVAPGAPIGVDMPIYRGGCRDAHPPEVLTAETPLAARSQQGLPFRQVSHRHHSRAELFPVHALQVDLLRESR